MSTAARKARKRLDRWIREEGLDLPTGFRHPTREGIPYGRSKQPSPMVFPDRLPPLGVIPEFRGWVR